MCARRASRAAGVPDRRSEQLVVDRLDRAHPRFERQVGFDPAPRRIGAGRAASGSSSTRLDRRRPAAAHVPVGTIRPSMPLPDDFRGAAGAGRDDRGLERHRLEHRVRRALVVRRLHEQVERVVQVGDVGAMAEQAARFCRGRAVAPGRASAVEQAAVAGNDQLAVGDALRCSDRKGVDEQVEPLLRFEPADRADDEVDRGRAPSARRDPARACGSRRNACVVDAVQHDVTRSGLAPCRTSSCRTSVETAIDRRKPSAARACRAGSRATLARLWPVQPCTVDSGMIASVAQQPRQEVGLVVVRVDDVDGALADEAPQTRPRSRVERMRFEQLDVVDRQVRCLGVDAEDVSRRSRR